jgi:sec-independent protein translocase protein TatB
MLDVGFSEILLTSAIALIVLGPERLPKVARQVGNWVGRARVMARQLSEQLEREVNAEELLKAQKKTTAAAAIDPAPTPTIAPPPAESPPLAESLTSAESPPPAESLTSAESPPPAESLTSAASPTPAETPPARPRHPFYATTPAAMHASDRPVTEPTTATAPPPPHE